MTVTPHDADAVTVAFAADTRNIALARMIAASMSARADLPIDRLEDARLAVDEALAQLIAGAPTDSEVVCTMSAGPGTLLIEASAPGTAQPPRTTFSWTVLTALADEVDALLADGRVTFRLRLDRHDA